MTWNYFFGWITFKIHLSKCVYWDKSVYVPLRLLIIEKILSSCIGGKCAKTVKTKCFNKMIENVFSISEIYIPMGNQMRWLSFWVFLSAVWQPQGQLWAIFEKTASLTQCLSLRLIYNWPKGHQEYFNDKSIFRAKHQDFILDTWFFYIFFRTNCV